VRVFKTSTFRDDLHPAVRVAKVSRGGECFGVKLRARAFHVRIGEHPDDGHRKREHDAGGNYQLDAVPLGLASHVVVGVITLSSVAHL